METLAGQPVLPKCCSKVIWALFNCLPALPDAWKDGSISGICAKGNFEVDMIWENHLLKEAVVRSNAGGNCVIKYADQTISFKTVKGHSYQIRV